MGSLYLGIAIVFEVLATSALKASDGFTRLWPSLISAVGYCVSFYALSICIKTMSVGIVYAMWSGLGIVLITIVGWFWFKQVIDLPALIGMGLIAAGVIVIQVFSESVHVGA